MRSHTALADVQRAEAETTVCVHGRVDAQTAGALRELLHAVVDEGLPWVRIDLADAEIGDATGLGVLVGAHHRARRLGVRVVVEPVTERTARLLRLAHLERALRDLDTSRPPAAAVAPLTA